MSRPTSKPALALACALVASCAQPSGVPVCLDGDCQTGPAEPLASTATITVSPASQTIAATAGQVPADASVAVTNHDSESIPLTVACTGAGATPVSSALTVAARATDTLQIKLAAPASPGSETATCTAKSSNGKTTYATFTIAVDASSAGSGGGAAGGSGGGAGGGSAGGSGGSSGSTAMSIVIEPAGGFNSVYSAINSATSSIDLVMYELADSTAIADLVAAGKRGVKVRVILDINSEESRNTSAYDTLKASTNVSVVWANKSFTVTHEKSMVIDAAVPAAALACIWTANLNSESYADTRDVLLYENDPADIAAMESTFDSDFANGGGSTYSPSNYTPPAGDHLLWSPTNAQSGLLAVINGAKSTLLLDEEEMEDTTMADALIARAKAGVSVKLAVTTSETTASLLSSMSAAGISIAEYPGTGTELYIHAKVIVADQGLADEAAFLGSINFSNSSLTANRELGLSFTDAMSPDARPIIASLNTMLEADVACSSDSSCTKY